MIVPKYFKVKHYSKFNIKDAKEIALFFGGKVISKKISSVSQKINWKCKDGHYFLRAPLLMKLRNNFCNKCSSFYLGEEIARSIMEKLTNHKFPKIRHKKILSDLGNPMEIDGFNHDLNIGFEHQGKHHIEKNSYVGRKWGQNVNTRDQLKYKQAKKIGINLIIFPEIPYYLSVGDAIKLAKKELKKLKIKFFNITPKNVLPIQRSSKIDHLNNLAKKFGGKLLSKNYLGMHHGYRWKCKNNHIFKAKAYNVKTGWWCKRCTYKSYTIKDLQKFASKKKGKCLSLKYFHMHKKYKWKCKCNNVWLATWAWIQNGTWCPACSGNKPYEIKDLRKFAKSKGGLFLSKKYISTHNVYEWQCKKGHKWSAAWHSVRRGTWCRFCAHVITANKNRKSKD